MVERFNDKVRSSEQVEKTFHLASLGTMSRWRDKIQTEDVTQGFRIVCGDVPLLEHDGDEVIEGEA